jgi:hypothetical protein
MGIELLKPEVRPHFETFLNALEKHGHNFSVLETLRTQEVQDAYYAQGRECLDKINRLRKIAGLYLLTPGEAVKIVTYVRHSYHQDGLAADIVPVINGKIPWDYCTHKELWLAFGRLGMEAGLEWGGTWKEFLPCGIGWDPPHYQKL